MLYEYPVLLTLFEDGTGYLAEAPDLLCCTTSGATVEEATDMIADAMSLWLIVNEDMGDEIPPATDFAQFCESYPDGVVIRVSVDTDEYRAMLEMYPPEPDEDDHD